MRKRRHSKFQLGDILEKWEILCDGKDTHEVEHWMIVKIDPEHVHRRSGNTRYYWVYTVKNLSTGGTAEWDSSWVEKPWIWPGWYGVRKIA